MLLVAASKVDWLQIQIPVVADELCEPHAFRPYATQLLDRIHIQERLATLVWAVLMWRAKASWCFNRAYPLLHPLSGLLNWFEIMRLDLVLFQQVLGLRTAHSWA